MFFLWDGIARKVERDPQFADWVRDEMCFGGAGNAWVEWDLNPHPLRPRGAAPEDGKRRARQAA